MHKLVLIYVQINEVWAILTERRAMAHWYEEY